MYQAKGPNAVEFMGQQVAYRTGRTGLKGEFWFASEGNHKQKVSVVIWRSNNDVSAEDLAKKLNELGTEHE